MPHLIITGIVTPEKPDMTIDAGGSLKDGNVVLSRPRTVRESPLHSLADRYLGRHGKLHAASLWHLNNLSLKSLTLVGLRTESWTAGWSELEVSMRH